MSYTGLAGRMICKSCMVNTLLFAKETLFCTTFTLRPTIGCTIQLNITKCITQSQLPSHTMHTIEIPHIPLSNTMYTRMDYQ